MRLATKAAVCRQVVAAALLAVPALADTPATDKNEAIAASLAEMVRDARTVISNNEDLINNPSIGDKHLSGRKVLDDAVALYRKNTGIDPAAIDPNSRAGR